MKIKMKELLQGKPIGFTKPISKSYYNSHYVVTVLKLGNHLSIKYQAYHYHVRGMSAEILFQDFFHFYEPPKKEIILATVESLVNNFIAQQKLALQLAIVEYQKYIFTPRDISD